MAQRKSSTKGFQRTASVLQKRIADASASRGFGESRMLTHWDEIAGPDIAAIARPIEVSYGRKGFGATLSLLTTGAHAPVLQMQIEKLREKVNAIYGYNAIARIRITQTAPTGFAEGQVDFKGPKAKPDKTPSPKAIAQAEADMQDVTDPGLRAALTRLASHVNDRH